ncbi:hypothetical protein [Mycolicibacterium houstonense]|uniref:hypothetical protein n=1 Tax=Mycolicibacterium houstonense TaxID=146021 RepID=UPI001C655224|nr:hypothetical protein [Mycolicibacterium houstonense]
MKSLHLVSPPVTAGEHPASTNPATNPENNTPADFCIVVNAVSPSDLVMRGTHHRATFCTPRRYR